jgi:hypothetical protein
MESRGRKEAGVVHSVETASRGRDKEESRVTVVCLRDAESSKYTVSDQLLESLIAMRDIVAGGRYSGVSVSKLAQKRDPERA